MIDLHSHIMYGIDDGSKSFDESIKMLKLASESGITDIFLTPHYIENSKFNVNNKEKEVIFNKLKKEIEEQNIDINIYIGNEIYINENILDHINNGEIFPLNNSKYLLIELPMYREMNNSKNIFFELIRRGYKVILAHPERYRYLDNKLNYFDELIDMGVLLQGNYRSLFGFYGKQSKKILKKLIKEKKISFLGSDIHKCDSFLTEKLEKKLIKYTKDLDYVNKILVENAQSIVKKQNLK